VLVSLPNEEWRTALARADSSLTLLHPTTLEIQFHKCLVTDDPLLPKLRLLGHLPSVSVDITDARLLQALSIAQSIPLPEEEKPSAELQRNASLSKSVSQLSLKDLGSTISSIADKRKQEAAAGAQPMKQTTDLEMKFEMKELTLSVSKQRDDDGASEEFVRFVILISFDLVKIFSQSNWLIELEDSSIIAIQLFSIDFRYCSWKRNCCSARTIRKCSCDSAGCSCDNGTKIERSSW